MFVDGACCEVVAQEDAFMALRLLDVSWCHAVTDDALEVLAVSKPSLKVMAMWRDAAAVDCRQAQMARPDKAGDYQSAADLQTMDPSVWRTSTERSNRFN